MTKEITIELDDAREVMHDEAVDVLGEEQVEGVIYDSVKDVLAELYDNRAELAMQLQEMEQ